MQISKSKSRYKVKFTEYIVKDDIVYYNINLTSFDAPTISLNLFERYSNLYKSHLKFKEEANSINYPSFPDKKIFSKRNELFLENRRACLESYFSNILSHKEFSQLEAVHKWIDSYKGNIIYKSENNNDFQSKDYLLKQKPLKFKVEINSKKADFLKDNSNYTSSTCDNSKEY